MQDGAISFQSDTIVIFEVPDLNGPLIYGCICTDLESYQFSQARPLSQYSLELRKGRFCYSPAIRLSALRNDFDSIAKMKKESSGIMFESNVVHIFRIVKNNSGWDVSFFEFKDFPEARD